MSVINTEEIRDSRGNLTGYRVHCYDEIGRDHYADVTMAQIVGAPADALASVQAHLTAKVAAKTAAHGEAANAATVTAVVKKARK